MKAVKLWVIALAFTTFGVAAQADSYFSFVARAGGTGYARAADGLWVQDGFEHKVDLTAPAVEVGLTGSIYQAAHWGIDWNVGYDWLGTIHTQGLATTDANYNLATKTWRAPMPLADFQGSGHDQGFELTIAPHYDFGEWRVGVDAGPYLHKASWSVDATNQVNFIGQAPGSTHFADAEGWHVGYVLGASVEYKRFSLRYQYFANGSKAGNPVPTIWTHAHVLTAGYTF